MLLFKHANLDISYIMTLIKTIDSNLISQSFLNRFSEYELIKLMTKFVFFQCFIYSYVSGIDAAKHYLRKILLQDCCFI